MQAGRGMWPLGIIAYAAGAIFLGIWLGSKVLAPMDLDGGAARTPEPSAPLQATQTKDNLVDALNPDKGSATKAELVVPPIEMHAVAAGPYEALDVAGDVAGKLMKRGAAGYVLEEDGSYYVLLNAYSTQEAAASVAARLDGEDGMALQTIFFGSGGVTLSISSSAERIEKMEKTFEVFSTSLEDLNQLWRDFDSGAIEMNDVIVRAQVLESKLEDARREAFFGTLIEGDVDALSSWNEGMQTCVSYIKTISAGSQSALSISAKIKYTYLACLGQYIEYINAMMV